MKIPYRPLEWPDIFTQMNVPAKLLLLNAMIVVTAFICIVTAHEFRKGATLHELDAHHLKHNVQFLKALHDFETGKSPGTAKLLQIANHMKDQPVSCVQQIGWLERIYLNLISTEMIIDICQSEVELVEQIISDLVGYQSGAYTRDDLVGRMEFSALFFARNSGELERLLRRTMDHFFALALSVLLLITLVVTLSGILLAHSVNRDYNRLRAAEKRMREANEELEEFAYRTSHDLRSPIVSTKGLLKVINESIEEDDKPTSLRGLELAQKSLTKLEKLILDILTLTSIGNQNEALSYIEINSELDEALEQLQNLDGYERLLITRDIEADNLRTKPTRFRLILENLISNAIKYQDPNEPNSNVHIRTRISDGEFVLEVEDNGLGIPPDQRDNLFLMFKRFHPEYADGTGLGLYLIQKSVNVLGGTINYVSHPDGSTFQIRIPAGGEKEDDVRPL